MPDPALPPRRRHRRAARGAALAAEPGRRRLPGRPPGRRGRPRRGRQDGPLARAAGAAGLRRGGRPASRPGGLALLRAPGLREALEQDGVETASPATCSTRSRWSVCPTSENVLFLAGMKFGATSAPTSPGRTTPWCPPMVARRYSAARASSCSRPATSTRSSTPERGGCTEEDPLGPVGEYAQSCLGRERVFEHFSRERGTAVPALPPLLRGGPALRHARGRGAPRARGRAGRPRRGPRSTRSGRATRSSYALRAPRPVRDPARAS